jgi:two-component sensor histidine kinase
MDTEIAMRLGLIINELITNSVKHVNCESVMIKINVSKNNSDETILSYKDNGKGIERHLTSENHKKSMGLQLISLLRDQLNGKVDILFT